MRRPLKELEAERLAEQTAKSMGFTALPICPFKIAERNDIDGNDP